MHTAERYSRQILLKEIGSEGQKKLSSTRFLIIGAGGLGCPAALALVEAGAGGLTIVDADTVDETNLPRQILHTPARIGINKAKSAAIALHELNPAVPVTAIGEWADDALLARLCADTDIVLDCCDNFRTRHAVNRAARAAGKPLIEASAVRYSGQIAVFDFAAAKSPCYQCLFPEDDCTDTKAAQVGVFSPATGVVGMMAAGEAIKLALGYCTLVGRLLMIDCLTMQTETMKFAADGHCSVCASLPQ